MPVCRVYLALVAVMTLAAAGANGKDFTLPVALHWLQNWAAVIGQMCKAAAAAGHEEPMAYLDKYFEQTYEMLDSLVSGSHTPLASPTPLLYLPLAACGAVRALPNCCLAQTHTHERISAVLEGIREGSSVAVVADFHCTIAVPSHPPASWLPR